VWHTQMKIAVPSSGLTGISSIRFVWIYHVQLNCRYGT
jgi:hypothetical protein